ncbi:MAG: hypothetical protein PVG07_03000 [Acidobacteriota bacterium]|jgi:hypothetical protein
MERPQQLSLFEVPAEREPEPGSGSRSEPRSEPTVLRARLHERLDRVLPDGLAELVLTDNRTVLVSGRPAEPEGWSVRLHWSFALAPEEVVRSLAAVLAGPRRGAARRRARQSVRNWISHFREATGPGPAPDHWEEVLDSRRREPATGSPAGHVHDLEAILDEVGREYFGGRPDVDIAWSRAGRSHSPRRSARRGGRAGRRSTIKLGSWSEEDRLVRIHPALDHPSVPRYVVASVVHHELLHAELGSEVRSGRRHHHTPEFRRREREFAGHEEARRWIRERLGELLKRRGGRRSGA